MGPAPMMVILGTEGIAFFEGKQKFEGRCEKSSF